MNTPQGRLGDPQSKKAGLIRSGWAWPSALLLLAALGVAFGAGWYFGIRRLQAANKSPFVAPKGSLPGNKSTSATADHGSLAWDPKGALGEIVAKYTGGARVLAIAKLVEQTPVEGLAKLIESSLNCPQTEIRAPVFEFAIQKWIEADPKAAIAFAAGLATREGNNQKLMTAFIDWAGRDPRAALATAETVGGQIAWRYSAVLVVLNAWAQIDPQAALAAFNALPPAMARSDILQAIFDRWSRQDPAAALAALGQVSNASIRDNLLKVILDNLADSDPVQALAVLRGLPGQQVTGIYQDVFAAMARQDPAAALAALKGIPAGGAHDAAVRGLFDEWAKDDPMAALQALQSLPTGTVRDNAVNACLSSLAEDNPQAAANYIAGLPPADQQKYFLNFAQSWARTDPQAALAWADQNARGADRDRILTSVFSIWSDFDPVAALATAAQLPVGSMRQSVQNIIAEAWGRQDPMAALAWVNTNLTGAAHDEALANVMNQLINFDPAQAATAISQWPENSAKDRATQALATALTAQDVPGALAWFQNLPTDTPAAVRNSALTSILNGWMATDLPGAVAYVQSLSGDPDFAGTVATVSNMLVKESDPSDALALDATLPVGQQRDAALSTALTAMAKTDPVNAWNYALQNLTTSQASNKTLNDILGSWEQQDPTAVAAVISSFPDGDTSGPGRNSFLNIFQRVAGDLMKTDPQGAAQWVQSLPPGNRQDAAIEMIMNALNTGQGVQQDPQMALKWARSISNDASRASYTGGVFVSWAQTDPDAAIAALQTSTLTPEQQAAVLQRIKNPPRAPPPMGIAAP